MAYKIMSHLVAGYPDYEASFQIAKALIDGGSDLLEVQFPFSDGTADGPSIQSACTTSLEKGFTVKQGFELVQAVRKLSTIPLFVMTYANIAFVNGIEPFLKKVKATGADGVIIPDLMPGSDEELYATGASLGLEVIPVVAPSIGEERLQLVLSQNTNYIYAALRKGITGVKTEIGEDNLAFLKRITTGRNKILAGFGITDASQVKALQGYAHAAIVGTEFLRITNAAYAGGKPLYPAILEKTQSLVCA